MSKNKYEKMWEEAVEKAEKSDISLKLPHIVPVDWWDLKNPDDEIITVQVDTI